MSFTEYDNYSFMYRVVSKYTGMDFKQLDELYCDEFLLHYRNAIIEQLMQSEEGIEILREFKYSQIDADEALDELDRLIGF